MVHQNSSRFYDSIIYDRNYNGLGECFEEGQRMADCFLGAGNESKRVMMQQNHGIFVIGPSASLAFDDTHWLEKACKV